MSTIVYQKLQPCYESNNFIESRQLSLKFNAPNDKLSQSVVGEPQTSNISAEEIISKPENKASNDSNIFSWSCIEALSNTHKETSKKEETVYIHPLVKRSSSKLSQKSLEMCTESLGCETGTYIFDSSVFFEQTMSKEVRNSRPKMESRKEITQVKLPPPLTSISGPNSIQVRPVRENGRLVIRAVSTPAKRSCLQAERSNGRLRLTLVKDYSFDVEEDNCRYDCETSDNLESDGCIRIDRDNDKVDIEKIRRNEAISEEEIEVKKGKEDAIVLGENMNDVKKVVLVKIQRPSRCQERGQGNKRLINWEPFWVAT